MTRSISVLLISTSLFLVLASCGTGGADSVASVNAPIPPTGGTSPPPPPPPANPGDLDMVIRSEDAAVVFLNRTTFGGRPADVSALVNQDVTEWLAAEFAKPATLYLPDVVAAIQPDGRIFPDTDNYLAWDKMITADDQLRQRMVFALSQIFAISDDLSGGPRQARVAQFRDVLSRNAFGNYRTLLEDVTYAPEMGSWLTYLQNRKGDPVSGRMPDENFAREIMQLFSIGLVELNLDGTQKTDGQGNAIELYDSTDVAGLARVFTGLSHKGTGFTRAAPDGQYSPMVIYPDQHSSLEKTFLGTTIPPNTSGEESITMALDEIFSQPSVAPFISRQLIQRFTASHPDPAYIQRVATVFNSGRFTAPNGREFGTGQRGDLEATLAAILLDESLYDTTRPANVADGKIREPVLRFIHWVRAFDAGPIISRNQYNMRDTSDPSDALGQHPFDSPSVFNFYRPGYVAPGTMTGARDLTAPEFQLVNASTTLGYMNYMTKFIMERTPQADPSLGTFTPDYSSELSLAYDETALIDHLSSKLTGGLLSDVERDEMLAILGTMPNRTDTPENEQLDRRERVYLSVLMMVNSSAYAVVR